MNQRSRAEEVSINKNRKQTNKRHQGSHTTSGHLLSPSFSYDPQQSLGLLHLRLNVQDGHGRARLLVKLRKLLRQVRIKRLRPRLGFHDEDRVGMRPPRRHLHPAAFEPGHYHELPCLVCWVRARLHDRHARRLLHPGELDLEMACAAAALDLDCFAWVDNHVLALFRPCRHVNAEACVGRGLEAGGPVQVGLEEEGVRLSMCDRVGVGRADSECMSRIFHPRSRYMLTRPLIKLAPTRIAPSGSMQGVFQQQSGHRRLPA